MERLNLPISSSTKKDWEIYYLQRKIKSQKRRYYNGVYSDDGIESDNEFSENDDESSNLEFVKKTNKTQARKETLARTTATTKPATKKKKKQQKGIIDYINN